MPALSRDQAALLPADAPLVLDWVRARVRGEGRRWTPVKSAVVEAILRRGTHLSAGEIQEVVASTFPMVQLSTVHRILNHFTALRLVHTLAAAGEARFGLVYPEHHHVVCASCGRLTDIPFGDLDEALGQAHARTGFRFERTSLTLSGICPECYATRLGEPAG